MTQIPIYKKEELIQHSKDLNNIFKSFPKEIINHILSFDSLYHSIKDYTTVIINIVLDKVNNEPIPDYMLMIGYDNMMKKNLYNIRYHQTQVYELVNYNEWNKKGILRKPKIKISKNSMEKFKGYYIQIRQFFFMFL